jgi:4-amino-4-deoxy-L-arabinose transferase-like glycosyltransferase
MTVATPFLSAQNRLERLFDALVDPVRRERTMAVVLAGYFAIWSLYATIAQSSQDIHTDMGEYVAWSREVGLGTPKHPPLGAWLVRAWFSVFPREDWAYYCFAILLPTVALWLTWRLAARHLPPDKRVAGIVLLTFVPFYNFHAIKFNANTVLTPFWALATWWFLRSFETRRVGWAVLAGIAAAAAMFAKYWSVTLLAGLGVAALSDPRRTAYFSSPAPYLTLAVGTVLLTPNIYWLTAHAFMPFSYAMEAHSGTSALALFSALIFTSNGLAYAAAAMVLCVLATRPSWAAIRDTLWPAEPERRTLVIAFAAPFAFAALIAVLLMVAIESIWVTPGMTLLPIVLLSSPLVAISRQAAVRLLALAVVFPLFMLAVSPLVALGLHLSGVPDNGSDYRAIAQAVERVWRAHTDQPLRIVGSTTFVNGIVFYFKDQPSTLDINNPKVTPWVSVDRIGREGAAIVCPEADAFCMRALRGHAAYYHVVADESVVVSRRFFGFASPPERYEIIVIPPDPSQGMHSAVAPAR